ncbi:MAG: hypothetical protein P8R42_08415 [Candidatus Binatia bacterium]|nr:hypothetical protein [Candidatus Binatia bacterium]
MPLRHIPPLQDQSRSRLESWLHVVLLVALSTYFEAQFVYVGVNATDEGWILYAAMRLWDGGTLYDDIFFVFPPGHVLPAWIAYGLAAPGLVLSRWIYAGFNVALCVALYLLGRRITRPMYAFIAVAMVAVYSPYSHGAHFLFGYRYLVWSILALLAFSQRLRTDDHRWMMLAGALAGIALCFRLTPAFSVSVGIGFGILAASRDWRLWLRDGAWYTAGLLLVAGPVLAWLFSGVGPLVVWSEAVQRAVEMTKLQAVDMPPLHFPWGWERQEIQGALVAVVFRAAPLFYVSYIVLVLTMWARDLRSGVDCRRPLLIAIVFFGAVYLGRGFGRADQGHLDTAMPPVLLLLGHMLGGIESRLAKAMSARAATAIVATAGVALLVVSVAGQRSDDWMFSPAPPRVPIKAVQGRIKRWIYNNKTDPAVAMIKRSTRATDTILDLSASPLFSVLSGRRGPGYADIVMPGTFRDAAEESRFVERLRADPPAFVLEPKTPFDAVSANALALTAPELTVWIEDNYGRGPETPHFVGRPRRPQPLSAQSDLSSDTE